MMDNVPVMTNGIVYNNVRVTKRVPIRKESPQLNLLNLWNVKVFGSLPEWLNGTVLKTVILERVSGVRIPELPQILGLITLRLTGSKLSIDYGVMVHRDRNWSSGLRFESFLVNHRSSFLCSVYEVTVET